MSGVHRSVCMNKLAYLVNSSQLLSRALMVSVSCWIVSLQALASVGFLLSFNRSFRK